MNAPARKFEAKEAVREEVSLLVGLQGPPGGGKTYSALRLARGMQEVRGGDIVVIDTEGKRALKYAGIFKFRHISFEPPFRSTDFLAAVQQQLSSKPAAIIIDSLSDEHEGPGGVLDWHERELERMAGDDWSKRERVIQAAWIKPKRGRVEMISGFLRIEATPLLFCFRAREKTKQIKNDRGKMEPVNIGFQPIAPLEIVHQMDLLCLLPPRAEGVPVWKSDKVGEDFIIKLPEFLKPFIREGQPLSEEMGKAFAEWARGTNLRQGAPNNPRNSDIKSRAEEVAQQGTDALKAFWRTMSEEDFAKINPLKDALKAIAAKADREAQEREQARERDFDETTPQPAGTPASEADSAPASIPDRYNAAKERGKADHAAGMQRKALPPEWRDEAHEPEARGWQDGWDEADKDAAAQPAKQGALV